MTFEEEKLQEFDKKFGIFGSFWERWASGEFPEQGGITEDVKAFIAQALQEQREKILEEVSKAFVRRGNHITERYFSLKEILEILTQLGK